MQFINLYYIMHIMACTMCLLIGSCWMFMTFAKEIRQEWETANKLSEVNQVKFKQHVHEFIEFHSSVKQLRKFRIFHFSPIFSMNVISKHNYVIFRFVAIYSDIYGLIITCYFLWSLLSICGSLLMVELEIVEYLLFIILHIFHFVNLLSNAAKRGNFSQFDDASIGSVLVFLFSVHFL